MIKLIKIEYNSDLYKQAVEIRKKVFVIEQNIPQTLELDQYDETSQHYLAFFNDNAVGTARWRHTENGIKFERFAVLKEFRNKNIGQNILNKLIGETLKYNKTIYLNAQINALNFYLKNKFIVKGESFFEAGIEHYKMIFSLP